MFKVTVVHVEKFISQNLDCTKVDIAGSIFNYSIDCTQYREYKFLTDKVSLYFEDKLIQEYNGKMDFIVYNKSGILIVHSSTE